MLRTNSFLNHHLGANKRIGSHCPGLLILWLLNLNNSYMGLQMPQAKLCLDQKHPSLTVLVEWGWVLDFVKAQELVLLGLDSV